MQELAPTETAGQHKRAGLMSSQPHKCPGNEFPSTAFAVYLTTSAFLKKEKIFYTSQQKPFDTDKGKQENW